MENHKGEVRIYGNTSGLHTHVSEDGSVYAHVHENNRDVPHTHPEQHSAEHVHSHSHTHSHTHTHVAADGTVYEHSHIQTEKRNHVHSHEEADEYTHVHSHTHVHTHENTKAVLNRLSRLIGHLQSIKRMVEDGRDCSEVLIQLSAVKAAINNTGKVILQDHIQHCLVDAIATGDMQEIEELNKAIDRFIK